jgi:hypothetical protein
MKGVRLAITLLILVLVAVSVLGWIWTGAHQTAAQAFASRLVLTIAALAALIGLVAIWRVKGHDPRG